jgi:hypothetical protein
MDATTITEKVTVTWRAKGFTDDVTECERCGKVELKGTVRMVAVDTDGNEDGEQYMGTDCAARMTGRKVAEIRTEINVAEKAARAAWNAWSNTHSAWKIAQRDEALGTGGLGTAGKVTEIGAYFRSEEFKAAESAWITAHPAPARPY